MRPTWTLFILAGCGRIAFDGAGVGVDDARSDDGSDSAATQGTWTDTISSLNAPSPRAHHSAVWTGDRMLVYGGISDGDVRLGLAAEYDPVTDTWTSFGPQTGEPTPRGRAAVVWTGTQLIVWAGWDGAGFDSGGRFDRATSQWMPISSVGAPGGRMWPAAVWTGTEMLVWGGNVDGNYEVRNDGGRYDPVTDTWGPPMQTTGAPGPRNCPAVVWTGSEMLVWGGWRPEVWLNDGTRYDPVTDSWGPPISTIGAPAARTCASAVWTGTEMVVWAGSDGNSFSDGAAYNPATDTWRPIESAGAPLARWGHSGVWTGTEMIVWGGDLFYPDANYVNDGKRFVP